MTAPESRDGSVAPMVEEIPDERAGDVAADAKRHLKCLPECGWCRRPNPGRRSAKLLRIVV